MLHYLKQNITIICSLTFWKFSNDKVYESVSNGDVKWVY